MRQLYDATMDSTPLPEYVSKEDADAGELRAFWRGLMQGVPVGAMLAFLAYVAAFA